MDVGIFDVAQRLKDRDDTAGRIALEELSAETSADELLLRKYLSMCQLSVCRYGAPLSDTLSMYRKDYACFGRNADV